MPKRSSRSRATIRAVSTIRLRVSACGTSRERDVHRHRHDRQGLAPQHHHRMRRGLFRRGRERGEELRVAGMRESGLVEHVLGDRVGHQGGGLAPAHRRDRAFDRFDRRWRACAGPAGPAWRIRRPRAERPAAPAESLRRRGGVARDDRHIPAEIAARGCCRCAGFARTANGGTPRRARRSQALSVEFGPDTGRVALRQTGGARPPALLGDALLRGVDAAEVLADGRLAEGAQLEAQQQRCGCGPSRPTSPPRRGASST